MKKLWILVGTLILGNAQAADGNDLLSQCQALYRLDDKTATGSDFVNVGKCAGYSAGVAETLAVFSKEINRAYCLPKVLNTGQMARVVLKFLEEHPEKLHKQEFVLTYEALTSAFPCPQK